MATLRPTDDRIVVLPDEPETRTTGGIVIPESHAERSTRGKVIAVGPGKLLDDGSRGDMGLEEGDRVLYTRYAGTEILVEGVEHTIMRVGEVLAILPRDEEY